MGWLYGWSTRKSMIAELTTENDTQKCIANCYRGNVHSGVLWSVWEYKIDGQKVKAGYKWIRCDILKCHNREWGYKDLSESMHPFYYSCPLAYLKMTADSVECQAWRDVVIKKDQHRKWQALQAKLLKIGDIVPLKGCNIPYAQVSCVNPLRGGYRGLDYKISKKYIDIDRGISLMKV